MKDFHSTSHKLNFLQKTNYAAVKAILQDDNELFSQAIDELESAELWKDDAGRKLIEFYNQIPHNTINDSITDIIKTNPFFMADTAFRMELEGQVKINGKMVDYIDNIENFNDSFKSLKKNYIIPELDKEAYQKGRGYGRGNDLVRMNNAVAKAIVATLNYQDLINKTLINNSFKELEVALSDVALDEYRYRNIVIDAFYPLKKLCEERKQHILVFCNNSLELIDPLNNLRSYPELDNILKEMTHENHDGTFFFSEEQFTSSFDKNERYSIQQYLTQKCGYSKNRPSMIFNGNHYSSEWNGMHRDLALRIFLYLGIPFSLIDQYFELFGIIFGKSSKSFYDKERGVLTESNIRNLIKIGLSYDVIQILLPKFL